MSCPLIYRSTLHERRDARCLARDPKWPLVYHRTAVLRRVARSDVRENKNNEKSTFLSLKGTFFPPALHFIIKPKRNGFFFLPNLQLSDFRHTVQTPACVLRCFSARPVCTEWLFSTKAFRRWLIIYHRNLGPEIHSDTINHHWCKIFYFFCKCS